MNLYFLVEGRRTEKRVYARWLAHTFPALSQVHSFAQVQDDHYLIVSGGGQPRAFEEIGAAIENICLRPVIDHLFICVDAEEDDYDAKRAELDAEIARWSQESRVHARAPRLQIHPIVQNCCIETWFLGNSKMMRPSPSSLDLARYKAFYDVRTQDPELMESIDQLTPRAVFHGRYLKAMLRERNPGLRYTKQNPGVVGEREYLDALRDRCQSTGQLAASARHLGYDHDHLIAACQALVVFLVHICTTSAQAAVRGAVGPRRAHRPQAEDGRGGPRRDSRRRAFPACAEASK